MLINWNDHNRAHIAKHGGSEALFELVLANSDQWVLSEPLYGHTAIATIDGKEWQAIFIFIHDLQEVTPITIYPTERGA
jgi:hypothetical protein